ncbi:glycosyltransferase family 39 protein [Cellulomonas aerilata]|uniref:Uncharacterized protein n=1 Tax=Cellulomonas aerilata TaxID=515326 RepID=A0A512D9M0_9CELL|nr:glycosyltransferase family 39 protein [Cellulomonas aerilata]GEO33182.1 hypothetical protein CAE01nite_09070 [Cellulomonas aerilata]
MLVPGAEAGASPDRRSLARLCLLVALVRVSYVLQPLRNDEGGYLLVARQWRTGGPLLYGDYLVDRPPVLLALFRLAATVPWDGAIRVLAVAASVVFVVAGAQAGRRLGGRSGARWAAGAAAAAVCSPALAADQAEGELFAAVLALVALALALVARDATPARRRWWAAAAGVAAGAAPLVKQSALEGLVVLAIVAVLVARAPAPARRRGAAVVAAAGAGVLVPVVGCAAVVVASGADPAGVWRDLVGLRAQALDVIWSSEQRATLTRALQLVGLGLVSGVLGCIAAWWGALRAGATVPWRPGPPAARTGVRRPGGLPPEHLVITALLGYALVAIVAGGSYWPSYGVQLAPAVVVAVAVVAPTAGRAGRRMRAWVGVLATTAAVGSIGMAVVYATVPDVWFQQRAGQWLGATAAPGDSAVVAYGHASILEAADLPSPYPYLWSVPMRTLDPEQDLLRSTLAGGAAPAWVVQVNPLDSWGIDSGGRLRAVVERRYRVVTEVCGTRMWLRADLTREPAPLPEC